ncbi:MAG: hypothetical protein NC417_13600 [Candidatus Gastranaerophilales bacterium]|nr:hypothetical protein [Candidatus Gastranaerophilales bacterium]
MSDKELKKYLRQELEKEYILTNVSEYDKEDVRLKETIKLCTEMMREQKLEKKKQEDMRTSFVQYLSDIFRFEGIPVFGLQAATLFIICLIISTVTDIPRYIPSFMPLFVLTIMPVMFKCQYYGMSEMEAVTRASGSQIVLAKLILAGAANLVCMTLFIFYEIHLQDASGEIGQIILYCMVPYLVCMVGMLRSIRLRGRESIQICSVLVLGSCVCWGMFARILPWLYEASAFGIWMIAFLFFAAFFGKEIYFIVAMRKEGKIYGIIN